MTTEQTLELLATLHQLVSDVGIIGTLFIAYIAFKLFGLIK